MFCPTSIIGLRFGKEGLILPPLRAAKKQKHIPPVQKTYTLHYALCRFKYFLIFKRKIISPVFTMEGLKMGVYRPGGVIALTIVFIILGDVGVISVVAFVAIIMSMYENMITRNIFYNLVQFYISIYVYDFPYGILQI